MVDKIEREHNLRRLKDVKIKKTSADYLVYYFYHKALKNAATQYAKGKLLDIGCGNKPYLQTFQPHVTEYIGCDIIQSSENCVDVIAPANNIPVESNLFDTVLSTQTIEHVADCQGLVNEAYRVLKSGGHFIVSGPMYWPLHEEPYDFYRFTKHGFQYLLENAGFEVVTIIPNGGKWALFGQTIFHTFPKWILLPKIVKIIINKLFLGLDNKHFDPINTMNYVAIGRKK